MDPLTVATGVVGLLTGASKLIQTLHHLGDTIKEARKDASAAAIELSNITVVVGGLQTYVFGQVQASPQRLQLITVEHITATLTGCIVTFSELDTILKSLHTASGMGAWDRTKWLLEKEHVGQLVQRMQNHKLTFTMMLNILQCASMADAERNMDSLCESVNQLLLANRDLSLRLRNMEHVYRKPDVPEEAESVTHGIQEDTESLEGQPPLDNSSIALERPDNGVDAEAALVEAPSSKPAKVSAFEEQLHNSRVYRHAAARPRDSMISDARSTLALSISSSLTLGDVSKISVFALPVYISELSNGSNYDVPQSTLQTGNPEARGSRQQIADSSLSGPARFRNWWRRIQDLPINAPGISVHESLQLKKRGEQAYLRKKSLYRVFGAPLSQSIRLASVSISLLDSEGKSYVYGQIPIVVAKCGAFLKEKGTEVEQIFALSGSPKRLAELRGAFNSPPEYGQNVQWSNSSVHDGANLLIRYLLELPEAVIPSSSFSMFQEAWTESESTTKEAVIQRYQNLVSSLPPLNRQLLLYILDLLGVFAYKANVTKVSAANLAGLFQTSLLDHPDHRLDPDRLQRSRDILRLMIENQEKFLMGMPATESNLTLAPAASDLNTGESNNSPSA